MISKNMMSREEIILENQKRNKEKNDMKIFVRVFEKYIPIYENMYKDQTLMVIHDSERIDWNEVSKLCYLPEIIMDEFDAELNWNLILFNRNMDKKTVKTFEQRLLLEIKRENFVEKLNDEHLHVVKIVDRINNELLPKIFLHACSNGFEKLFKFLITKPLIDYETCDEAFDILRTNNNPNSFSLFKILLMEHKSFSDDDLQVAFIDACDNNYIELVKILIEQPCISKSDIKDALDDAKQSANGLIEILSNAYFIPDSE